MTEKPKILIVEARFYGDIADALVKGAVATLTEAGAGFERLEVPGAFEIPAAIRMALGGYDGFIALGCVIRGETSHYDYVCGESARGLMDIATRHGAAIGYGILTCENREQAWARADGTQKNKGRDAALACLAMIGIAGRFRTPAA